MFRKLLRRRLPEAIPSAPVWSRTQSRPRILVEADDPVVGWAYSRILSDAGYAVMVCGGPSTRCGNCPLLEGRVCLGARDADGIVFALSVLDPDESAILKAHRAQHPDVGVCVEIPALTQIPADIENKLELLSRASSRQDILRAVERAVSEGSAEGRDERV